MPEIASREEAQAAIDEWVRQHQPAQTAIDLARLEAEHLDRFKVKYGRFQAQFDVAFDQLNALVEQVNYLDRSSWPAHRHLQFILLSHNLTPFVSALDRASRGYYADSVSHSRTLYETVLRLVFISCHHDENERMWTALPVKRRKGVRTFGATNFASRELRLNWQLIYSTMSAVAHSNFPDVAQSVRPTHVQVGEPEIFGLRLGDEPLMLEFALTFVPFLLAAYLRFVVECCVGDLTVRDTAQLISARQALDWMTFIVADSPRPFWKIVAQDLDYVFDVIRTADEDGDWKAIRDQRPVVPPDGSAPG